ncbi:DedA family inner membrane protein YghB [Klebsiella pneumoniae]|uniref:Inner membrane protein YghB n=1 Tax=Klebsiella pneumoniae TaxID=573 RepID=A0A377XE50_KLEPN|nr:DedA family inner membrane protein YghB [Klebsiella pneumoniae]
MSFKRLSPRCGNMILPHWANPHVVGVVYLVMFATLFLENGLLPASFLPGDSLLLLAGALIAKGVMDFVPTIAILTAAASLGCWLSYVQGRWLGNTQTVKGWLAHLPHKYHQRATCMFDRHGLLALLAGRFWRLSAPCCQPWPGFLACRTAASSSSTG